MLHYSISARVRKMTDKLQKALRGPAAEVATMTEVANLQSNLSK